MTATTGAAAAASVIHSFMAHSLRGTEPVVRVYTEARSEEGLKKLSTAGKHWIFE
jgi:hypothetical protein